MGPATETLLGVLFLALVGIGALAYLGRPVWRRAYRLLKRWRERDEALERERRQESNLRDAAEAEIRRHLGEEDAERDEPPQGPPGEKERR